MTRLIPITRSGGIRMALLLLGLGTALELTGCGTTASAGVHHPAPRSSLVSSGVHRATTSDILRDGHFSDPYPLNGSVTPSSDSRLVYSGTFSEILTCTGTVRPGCFNAQKITVAFGGALTKQLAAAGDDPHGTKAHHIYRGTDGSWDMVFASELDRGNDAWNVIFHAHPIAGSPNASGVPTKWAADSILVGSLEAPAPANYDGKLVRDGNRLYLVYSGAISQKPQIYGVVAQPMRSPSAPAKAKGITLLAPEAGDGALNSENRFSPTQQGGFKIVETGNIVKVTGKYVMVYAVGAFNRPDYKIGVAYSDTLIPAHGGQYRKVLKIDTDGIWGKPDADEVRYLLQSEQKAWPNYAGGSVVAPGVGSLLKQYGRWYLFFAGYAKSEKATEQNGTFEGAHRQPYFVPIDITIDQHRSVTKASEQQLASWITPVLRHR